MFAMETVYLGAAALGGLLLLVLVVIGAFGGDAEVDVEVDFDPGEGAGGLSLRTAIAFLTFFGIGGMAATKSGLGDWSSGVCAVLAGSFAFWISGLVMAQLYGLRSEGNVNIANAVGIDARVYLAIPGAEEGEGKISVAVQGRTVEYRAVTTGRTLRTGEYCRVKAVRGPTTVEVEALTAQP